MLLGCTLSETLLLAHPSSKVMGQNSFFYEHIDQMQYCL